MDAKTFLSQGTVPKDFSPALRALWTEAAGDWHEAHTICQEGETRDGAWVHAWLHRKEGDAGNAQYWYAKSGRSPHTGSLEAERDAILSTLLEERAA